MRKILALALAVAGTSVWLSAQTGGKLTTDDLIEIQALYAKYNWSLDAGDAEAYASTFTPDGTFNNNVGHDAIVKFATTFHAGLGSHVKHWNTNLMILPTATGASGQVYLVLVDFATKPPSIATSASYADELVKTAQGWRFKKRQTKGDVAAAAPSPAARPQSDAIAGQWTGTWDGAGSGNFELNLQKKDGGLAGKVAVTTDGGNYDAELKGVSLADKSLKATYDFPLDPSAEVAMTASFDGEKATGTWSLRPKGGGAEVAGGTFALKKK